MASGVEQGQDGGPREVPRTHPRRPEPTTEDQETNLYRIMEFQTEKGVKPDTAHLPDMETEAREVERPIARDPKGCGWRQNWTPSPNSDSPSGAPSTVPASLALGKPPTGR